MAEMTSANRMDFEVSKDFEVSEFSALSMSAENVPISEILPFPPVPSF